MWEMGWYQVDIADFVKNEAYCCQRDRFALLVVGEPGTKRKTKDDL